MRLAPAAALALTAAACGQNDSDNVMAPQANALDPAQVDLALGPELTDAGANEAAEATEGNAAGPAKSGVTPEVQPAAERSNSDAIDETANVAPSDNSTAEERE